MQVLSVEVFEFLDVLHLCLMSVEVLLVCWFVGFVGEEREWRKD